MNPPFSLVACFGDRLAAAGPPEEVGGGFSGAAVFKVAAYGGAFALRGWPASAEPARVRGLHRLLRHVAKCDVPVAAPLVGREGDTLVRFDSRWWQVEPWLPGRADFRDEPTEARLTSAMTALAAFHTAAASFEPRETESEWFGGSTFGIPRSIRERIDLVRERLVGDEVKLIASRIPNAGEFANLSRRAIQGFLRHSSDVLRSLQIAGTTPVPLLPCLRDLWHDHLLFKGDVVTGVIDPAACRRDTVATDLSRLLGSLIGDDVSRWDFAISAYARNRPLSPGEVALIPVLDQSGVLLSAATWLRRRYLLDEPCETPAVVARLRETVERIERL